MSTRFPLQPLLDLSQLRLDDATRRLGELMSGEKRASERLALLTQYRAEYQDRFLAAAREGLPRDQWRNYQAFLDKLDDAIRQAEAAANQSRLHTQVGQRTWLDTRGQVKAYDTLNQNHLLRQQYAEQRRDQKAQDEHTAHRHSNKEDHAD